MNIERSVLLDHNEKEQVKHDFEKASETLHRVKEDLVQDDIQRMTRIIETANKLEYILDKSSWVYTNFSRFSSENRVIDILGYASNYMEEDFRYFNEINKRVEESVRTLPYDIGLDFFSESLEKYNPLKNGSFSYFDTFTSCLAIGQEYAREIGHVEESIELTTAEIETGIGNTDDDNSTAVSWEQLNNTSAIPSFKYCRQMIFSNECVTNVFLYKSVLEFMVGMVVSYGESYKSVTAFFPQDNLEQNIEHNKCIDTFDWFLNDSIGLLPEYFQYLNTIAEKVFAIHIRYTGSYEDRDDLLGEVQSLYEVVSELNNFLFTDEAALLWNLTTIVNLNDVDNDQSVNTDSTSNIPLTCQKMVNDFKSLGEGLAKADPHLTDHAFNHENLINTFAEFSNLLKMVNKYYQRKIKPDIEHFDEFLNKDIKKLELVRLITQSESIISTDALADKIHSIDDSLDDLIKRMTTEAETTEELLMIQLNMSVPLLSYQTINETVFGRELYKYIAELYTGFDDDDMQDHFQSTFLSTGAKHFQRILDVFKDLQSNITSTMDSLANQLADEREYLQTYKRDTTMDADFYMLVTCVVIIMELTIIITYI